MSQIEVHHLRAAPCVHQVVEACTWDAVFAHDLENRIDLAVVQLVDGETQPDLDTSGFRIGHAFHGTIERTWHTAELVVRLGTTIEGDAYIRQPHFRKLLGKFGRNERAVGGDNDAHPRILRILHEFDKVFAHARLSTAKQQHRRPKSGKVVDHGFRLVGAQLVIMLRIRSCITVAATKIARLRAIPNDHRLLVA